MKVLNEKPPEWIMTGCLSQFRVNVERTFWTYGDVIYNPGGIHIRADIVAHEERHMKQQAEYFDGVLAHSEGKGVDGKDGWWKRYLIDPRFRLEMEADAYGEQYRWYCARNKDRNARARFLHMLAEQLSGPLYQVAVSHQQASQMIAILSGQVKLPVQKP